MTDAELISVEKLGSSETNGFASDKHTWVLQLNSGATLRRLHRFVSERLKEGLHYRDPSCRSLAFALFSAAVHPRLRYVEVGRYDPVWLPRLTELEIFPRMPATSRGSFFPVQ